MPRRRYMYQLELIGSYIGLLTEYAEKANHTLLRIAVHAPVSKKQFRANCLDILLISCQD